MEIRELISKVPYFEEILRDVKGYDSVKFVHFHLTENHVTLVVNIIDDFQTQNGTEYRCGHFSRIAADTAEELADKLYNLPSRKERELRSTCEVLARINESKELIRDLEIQAIMSNVTSALEETRRLLTRRS